MNTRASVHIDGMELQRSYRGNFASDHRGEIDGQPFRLTVWEQPGGFAAQAILAKLDGGITEDIFSSHPTPSDAAHAALYDAYQHAAKRVQ